MIDFEEEIQRKEVLKEQQKLEQDRQKELAFALQSADGQIVLREIMRLCPIDEEVFSSDPCTTAYLCGKRSVGLAITSLVNDTNRKFMIKKKED